MLLIVSCVLVSSCSLITNDPVCTLNAAPGIRINSVIDIETGNDVSGFWGFATEGEFADSSFMPLGFNEPLSLAVERPGTYAVRVSRADYADWTRNGIEVKLNDSKCHVETVPLDVQLQPQ